MELRGSLESDHGGHRRRAQLRYGDGRWDQRARASFCKRVPSEAGLVHHSDRGSQYLSIRYTERLAEDIFRADMKANEEAARLFSIMRSGNTGAVQTAKSLQHQAPTFDARKSTPTGVPDENHRAGA